MVEFNFGGGARSSPQQPTESGARIGDDLSVLDTPIVSSSELIRQDLSALDAPVEVDEDAQKEWERKHNANALQKLGDAVNTFMAKVARKDPNVNEQHAREISPHLDFASDPQLKEADPGADLRHTLEGYYKATKNAWGIANRQMEIGKIGYNMLNDNATPEEIAHMGKLQNEIQDLTKLSQSDPFVAKAFGTLAPYLKESAEQGGKGALIGGTIFGIGAMIAGAAGPQAATPEEVITVPVATSIGMKLGSTFRSVENIRKIEAGSTYVELIDAGIDPKIAKAAAQIYGLGSAGMEIAQFRMLKNLIPGGDRLASTAFNKALTKVLGGLKANRVARGTGKLAMTGTGEGSVESLQEFYGNLVTEIAKEVNDATQGTDLGADTIAEFTNRLTQGVGEAFAITATGMGVAGVPGLAVDIAAPAPVEQEQVAAELEKTGFTKVRQPVSDKAPVSEPTPTVEEIVTEQEEVVEEEAQPEPTPEPTTETKEEVVEEQVLPQAPKQKSTVPDNKEDSIEWWQGASKPKQRALEQEVNEWEQHLAELKKIPKAEKTPEILEQEAEANQHLSSLNNLMGFKEEAKDPMKFNEHTGKFTQADLTTPATQSLDGTIHTAPEGEETLSRPFKASEPGKLGDELEAKYAQIPRKGARRGFKHPKTGKFIPGEAVVKKAKLDKKAKEAKIQREADLRQGEVEKTFEEWGKAIKQQEADRASRPATSMDEEFFTTPFKKRSTVQKVLRKLANRVSRGPLGKHFRTKDAEQSALMQGWLLISQKSAEEIEYFTNNPDSPEAKAFRRELFGTVMNRLRQERSAKLAEKIGGVSRKDVDKMLAAGQTLPTPKAYEEGVGSQSPLESKESLETQRQQADDDLLSAQRTGSSILDKYFGGDQDITAGKVDLRNLKGKSYKLKIAALRKRIQKLPPEDRPKAVSIVDFVEQNSTKGKNVIYPDAKVPKSPTKAPTVPKTAQPLPPQTPGQQVLNIPRAEKKIDLNVRKFDNEKGLKRDAELIRVRHKTKAEAKKDLYTFMRNTGEVSAKIAQVGKEFVVYIPKSLVTDKPRRVNLNAEQITDPVKKAEYLKQQEQKIEDEIAVREAGVVNYAILPSETEAQRDARVKRLLAAQRKILEGETKAAQGTLARWKPTPERAAVYNAYKKKQREAFLAKLDAKERAALEERQKKAAEKAKLEKERLLRSTGRRVLIWDSIKTEEQLIHEAREQDKADQRRKAKRSHDREAVKRRLSEKEAELKEMGKRAKASAKTRRKDQIAKDLELAGKSRKQRQKVLKAEKEGKVKPKPKKKATTTNKNTAAHALANKAQYLWRGVRKASKGKRHTFWATHEKASRFAEDELVAIHIDDVPKDIEWEHGSLKEELRKRGQIELELKPTIRIPIEKKKAAPKKKSRVATIEEGLLNAIKNEKGEVNLSEIVKVIKSGMQKTADVFDVEAKFRRIGAVLSGFRMKALQSREEAEVDRGIRQAKVFRKVLRDKVGRVTKKDLAILVLLAENPNFRFTPSYSGTGRNRTLDPEVAELRKYLTKEKREQLKPAAEWLRNFFDDSKAELEAHGVDVDFNKRRLHEIAGRMKELEERSDMAAAEEYERLSKQLYDIAANDFVSIPIQLWTMNNPKTILRDKPGSKVWKKNIQALRSAIAQTRQAASIGKLVNKGVLDLDKVNPFEVILGYAKRKGVDFALADLRDAAEQEGLLKYTKGKPTSSTLKMGERWKKVPDNLVGLARIKMVEGKPVTERPFIDSDLLEAIQETRRAIRETNRWERTMAMIKMAQFYNPLFLPAYDMYQHVMARGFIGFFHPKTAVYFSKAVKAVWNQNDDFHRAMSYALASKPFGMPHNKIKAKADTFAKEVEYGKWAGYTKRALEVALGTSLDKNLLAGIYHASFHIAWKMDETIRMATWYALRDKMDPNLEISEQKAAQVAAKFHGDYASVPAKTRKHLNKVFFTPTFQIAMTKLWATMVSSTFKTMVRRSKGPMGRRYAMGLVGAMIINQAFDSIMEGLGYEDDEWGVRYKKTIYTRRGQRELVVSYSHPANFALKWTYRIAKGGKTLKEQGLGSGLMTIMRYQLHPVWRRATQILDGEAEGGRKLWSPIKPLHENVANTGLFLMQAAIPLTRSFAKSQKSLSELEADKAQRRIFGALWDIVMTHFIFSYTRLPSIQRMSYKLQRLKREHSKLQKEYHMRNGRVNQEWIKNYREVTQRVLEEERK